MRFRQEKDSISIRKNTPLEEAYNIRSFQGDFCCTNRYLSH